MRFLERLAQGTVVFDGAMGTMLCGRGVFVNRCFDELNRSSPNLVRQVHAEYLEAGAEVVETNTFGAHRFKLGPHGFEAQVRTINREGARLAREAAKGRGLVAGAVGPIGKPLAPIGNVKPAEAQEAYRERAVRPAQGRGQHPTALHRRLGLAPALHGGGDPAWCQHRVGDLASMCQTSSCCRLRASA